MLAKILQAAEGSVDDMIVKLLGLTVNADTDDVRESVTVLIAEELSRRGAFVKAYDPKGMEQARDLPSDTIRSCSAFEEALVGADLCVLATEWERFVRFPLDRYRAALHRPVLVDLRKVFCPQAMKRAGFDYHSIGRPASRARRALVSGRGPPVLSDAV